MTYYVHVNQHIIRSNINAEVKQPPIAIKKGKHGRSTMVFACSLPNGSVLLSRADGAAILDCGARVVIECPTMPEIIE